jgi:hypothetical protein
MELKTRFCLQKKKEKKKKSLIAEIPNTKSFIPEKEDRLGNKKDGFVSFLLTSLKQTPMYSSKVSLSSNLKNKTKQNITKQNKTKQKTLEKN